jgi:hypothetical protein
MDVLQTSLDEVRGELEQRQRDVDARIDGLETSLKTSLGDLEAKLSGLAREQSRIAGIVRHIDREDVANRRRLHVLRASEEYELAFTEPEPLVSFILPTYDRYESLRDVALPSILGQTYANVEVIVVGDTAPPETAAAIAAIDDPRVRYYNRAVRGPYPEDPAVRWYMLGTPPYNDGLGMVRGRWITAMADDDAIRPNHTESLVAAAQAGRFEHCYGRHMVRYRQGKDLELGSFPPVKGEFVMQASVYHSGLRFLQMGTSDYLYDEPNDWSYCQRMLEIGVRFGMIEEIVCDKHETRYDSHDDWGVHGIPEVE